MSAAAASLLVFSASASLAGEGAAPLATDYPAIAAVIDKTIQANHYNPAELDSDHYRRVVSEVAALAKSVDSDDAFISGFESIWNDGPFSHVDLSVATSSAEDLAAYLDTLRIGGGGAVLSWQGDVAILAVNTMMGLDTIEEIDAAFDEISARRAARVIIDLRTNGGGAFAVRPLIGHLIDEPFIAGGFVSRAWNAAHERPPTLADMKRIKPWEGWSIRAFWADAQKNALTVVGFTPIEPIYRGPVFVLTSRQTASAAELAADALKAAGRARIIGEQTAGQMLSQKPYDVEGRFHLSLPIADYYSAKFGRIEGSGVEPDIRLDAEDALDAALRESAD